MKEHMSTVTRKGQVTIPADIRRTLNIGEGNRVAFTMEAGEVKLSRAGSVVAATAGALKSDIPPLSAEKERRAAEQAVAEDIVARMSDG